MDLLHRNDEDDVMNAETDEGTEVVPDEVDFMNLCALSGHAP